MSKSSVGAALPVFGLLLSLAGCRGDEVVPVELQLYDPFVQGDVGLLAECGNDEDRSGAVVRAYQIVVSRVKESSSHIYSVGDTVNIIGLDSQSMPIAEGEYGITLSGAVDFPGYGPNTSRAELEPPPLSDSEAERIVRDCGLDAMDLNGLKSFFGASNGVVVSVTDAACVYGGSHCWPLDEYDREMDDESFESPWGWVE